MDAHGMPSGGDWALERTAAIVLENTENAMVYNNLFIRLGGNGVLINRYNRNAQITDNEFIFLGNTAIISWGDTKGISFDQSYYNPFGDANQTHMSLIDMTTMGYDGFTEPRLIPMQNHILSYKKKQRFQKLFVVCSVPFFWFLLS